MKSHSVALLNGRKDHRYLYQDLKKIKNIQTKQTHWRQTAENSELLNIFLQFFESVINTDQETLFNIHIDELEQSFLKNHLPKKELKP